jgi:hypothetical protein
VQYQELLMTNTLETPRQLVQSWANFRLPAKLNAQLQDLMERNNEGQLLPAETEQLEALVELSEELSLLKAQALQALGQRPI